MNPCREPVEVNNEKDDPLLLNPVRDGFSDPQPVGAKQQSSLQVTMCRYSESGILMKAVRPVDGTQYVAISHVWGNDAEWKQIPGVEGDVFASKEKIKFLTQRLSSILDGQ
jgi:hypothetical protein